MVSAERPHRGPETGHPVDRQRLFHARKPPTSHGRVLCVHPCSQGLSDYILFFNAGIFMLFGLPHIFAEDGNLLAMGWEIGKFMPMKGKNPLPVPQEISLLITHLAAILGSAQVALVVMCLLAAISSGPSAKKLALQTIVFYQLTIIAIQFYKPSGTGADGSPAMGPLPILIGLAVPSVVGAYLA